MDVIKLDIQFSICMSDHLQEANNSSVDLTCNDAWCIFLKMNLFV